jgi:hypothetical protein
MEARRQERRDSLKRKQLEERKMEINSP